MTWLKTNNADQPAAYLAQTIVKKLQQKQRVLWLIAGGSAIEIALKTAAIIIDYDLTNLSVTLTDERYGPVGHADSNWQQLNQAGFKLPGAKLYPVLQNDFDLDQSAKYYSEMLEKNLKNADYSLALAGMGPDGHIFGIKPSSPSLESKLAVIGYEWDDYIRLTPTFETLKLIDEVVVYAVGESKWQQLENLQKDVPATQQPAQLLKRLKKVIIYNDYKGDSQ